MSWWGKVIGGTFGFMLGGPLGAILGTVIGHNFDSGISRATEPGFAQDRHARTQTAFFTATFAIMGKVAKVDGRVSEDEIGLARAIMDQMQLNEAQRQAAIQLFAQGKQVDFPLHEALDQLRRECHRRHTLLQMFLEIQLHAAYADGVLHTTEKKLLLDISERLGFTRHEFDHLEAMVRAQRFFDESAGAPAGKPRKALLKEAYGVLGVPDTSNDAEIKKAYRRLMNQHHPDKLVAKGLPEEMIKLATEKTHEIRSAYETVMASRKD